MKTKARTKPKLRPLHKRGQLKDWTDAELIDHASSLHHQVNVVECFGSRDVMELHMALCELERRDFDIDDARQLVITKPEED